MANKKVWAYAKNEKGEFIKEQTGRLKLYFVWQALKMKREDTFNYNKVVFYSTQKDKEKRSEMVPVKNGFFRYKQNNGSRSTFGGDAESLSHEISILALSQLEKIHFIIKDEEHIFQFSEIRIEDTKIQFENGNFYFPDLIGFFTSESIFYEKWGGKVALEVKVTHACEPEKIRDFEDHCIPIIEISISEKIRFYPEKNKVPFDDNDQAKYYNYLISMFGKKVYGKVLSNPNSLKYQKTESKRLEQKMNEKVRAIDLLEENNFALKRSLETEGLNNEMLDNQLNILKKDYDAKDSEYTELSNRSFLRKLIALFQ